MITIIFDFDGTIADTVPAIRKILERFWSEMGREKLKEKEIEELRSYPTMEIVKQLHIPTFSLPFFITKTRNELTKEINKMPIYENMKKILLELKSDGYNLGIVTSNNKDNVSTFLKSHSIDVFDFIYTGISLFGKASILNNAIKKYGLEKKQIIYVGDEIRDIEAAKKSKIKIIAVTWGFNSKKGLEKYKPDYLIDSPKQIPKVLKIISANKKSN